jgi:hypothetical protein
VEWSVHLLWGAASEEKLNLDARAEAGFSGGSDFDAAADEDADAEVEEALGDDRDEIRRSSSDWPDAADDAGIARLEQQRGGNVDDAGDCDRRAAHLDASAAPCTMTPTRV